LQKRKNKMKGTSPPTFRVYRREMGTNRRTYGSKKMDRPARMTGLPELCRGTAGPTTNFRAQKNGCGSKAEEFCLPVHVRGNKKRLWMKNRENATLSSLLGGYAEWESASLVEYVYKWVKEKGLQRREEKKQSTKRFPSPENG